MEDASDLIFTSRFSIPRELILANVNTSDTDQEFDSQAPDF